DDARAKGRSLRWRARARRATPGRAEDAPGVTAPASRDPSLLLQLGDGRLRHVLVLLRSAAANPARALDHAVLDDRHGAHARDHVAALGGDDALDDRGAGALGQFAACAAGGGRGEGPVP